jgi:hypothetical protein
MTMRPASRAVRVTHDGRRVVALDRDDVMSGALDMDRAGSHLDRAGAVGRLGLVLPTPYPRPHVPVLLSRGEVTPTPSLRLSHAL